MEKPGVKKPTFLWTGILILLPLFLLAGIGLYSLRQDRILAGDEARHRCGMLADQLAATVSFDIWAQIRSPGSEEFGSQEIRLDAERHPFPSETLRAFGLRDRANMQPDPRPQPLPTAELSPEQMQWWNTAREAEFTKDGAAHAIEAYRKFIDLAPTIRFRRSAKYALALLLAKSKDVEAANKFFSDVEKEPQAISESGLPLNALAQWQRLELVPANSKTFAPLVESVCSNAVNFPSYATPLILERACELTNNPSLKWLTTWKQDEAARDFFQHTKNDLALENPQRWAWWAKWKDKQWLVVLRPIGFSGTGIAEKTNEAYAFLPFSEQSLQAIVEAAVKHSPPLPNYARLGIEVAGRPIIDPRTSSDIILASALGNMRDLEVNADEKNSSVVVKFFLHDPAALYAQQRQRTIWFAALILVSALAATVGFVNAYRGFQQQMRLSELKTNFVSSVSHELRAPIASMRLLAEALDRGKIADSVKQKEYFGFLVQESRRLSSLIENVLDFSRIEQGRKQYQFEATDVTALTEQTVKLMTPCAAERQVELQLIGSNGHQITCDGLAVQQALVNLIDNAIKHSPSGAKIRVGLEPASSDHGVQLWVEDEGAGIPPEDHERIFERFFRRGSELRRETQGIGIGLAIVKHVVDAHGGRVLVRSGTGRGSRFTIVLPDCCHGETERNHVSHPNN